MNIQPLKIENAFLIKPTLIEDERGFFSRTFCADEFHRAGLEQNFPQSSISFNKLKGTLRGIHFQRLPHEETKLIRCTMGAIFDVIVDLRPDSPTYLAWQGIELSAENRDAVYLPAGCGHGFQTLKDNSEVFYQISTPYAAQFSDGLRFDDPGLTIGWPMPVTVISARDSSLPFLKP